VQQAIEKEFQLCESIRRRADEVIDTTQLTPVQLKNVVVDRFKLTGYEGMSVKLESFGYRNGIPSDADLVFDVRCVPNPYYVPQLKNHSGLDDPVYDYVFQFGDSRRLAGAGGGHRLHLRPPPQRVLRAVSGRRPEGPQLPHRGGAPRYRQGVLNQKTLPAQGFPLNE
jgi:hypothetical protein